MTHPSVSDFNDLAKGLIDKHLTWDADEDEDYPYGPLIEELGEKFHDEMMKVVMTMSAAATSSASTPIKRKKRSTASGEKKAGNDYSDFVGVASAVLKDSNPVASKIMVTPAPNFKDGSKSAARFETLDMKFDDGKEMPFNELVTMMKEKIENRMALTGVLWGLLDEAVRKELVATKTA